MTANLPFDKEQLMNEQDIEMFMKSFDDLGVKQPNEFDWMPNDLQWQHNIINCRSLPHCDVAMLFQRS